MQSHPLRAPLALARQLSALDNQSIPGRLDAFGGYSAHEHPYVIRQQPAMKRRPGAPKATLAMAIVSPNFAGTREPPP